MKYFGWAHAAKQLFFYFSYNFDLIFWALMDFFGVSSYRLITYDFWVWLNLDSIMQFEFAVVGVGSGSWWLISPNPDTVLVILL